LANARAPGAWGASAPPELVGTTPRDCCLPACPRVAKATAALAVADCTALQPGQLAKWMHKHKITVSCFTPAMGQLLTTVAEPGFLLEGFRMAFFVGDVLIKRDIARLKALAPRVTVVNMYGSTETQRSVGHFVVQATPY
jgi:acyl-coenzyme A synthetase/AMP-(fatty) acid ligase